MASENGLRVLLVKGMSIKHDVWPDAVLPCVLLTGFDILSDPGDGFFNGSSGSEHPPYSCLREGLDSSSGIIPPPKTIMSSAPFP